MSDFLEIQPTHLFLADVHLGGSRLLGENYEMHLCSLIRHAAENKIHLYLLGDVFDYWMEFPERKKKYSSSNLSAGEPKLPPIGSTLLDTIQEYNKTFTTVYYILGNHDCWDAGYFNSIGCKVFTDGCKIKIDEQTICLLHGDGLPTKWTHINENTIGPLKRPLLHTILRSRAFIRLFQYLFTPKQAWSIMQSFSNFSKKKEKIAKPFIDSSLKYLIDFSDIDLIIAGHDHLARTVSTKGGQYINTGPYYEDNLVLTYSEQGWAHAQWDQKMARLVVKEQPIYTL